MLLLYYGKVARCSQLRKLVVGIGFYASWHFVTLPGNLPHLYIIIMANPQKEKDGWISIHRKIMEKGYYKKGDHIRLWFHILLKANHKDKEFWFNGKNILIKRGQFITGRKKLSTEIGISESKIERILNFFEKNEQQIEQQKTNKNRLITIRNWEQYQNIKQQNEQPVNNKRTTSEQQVNTNNNDNNVNNDNKRIIDKLESISIHKYVIKEIEKLIKKYGCNELIKMIDRFESYQKEFIERGWDTQYRLTKRWNKFVENISYFETQESLNQQFQDIAKRENSRKKPNPGPESVKPKPETDDQKLKRLTILVKGLDKAGVMTNKCKDQNIKDQYKNAINTIKELEAK